MKKSIYLFAVILASLIATGCGSKFNPGRNIDIARAAIAGGDFEEALSALDEVNKLLDDTTASPCALTQTAVLYCVIDERLNNDDNMSKARKCYELAMRINPDSVNACFAHLSPDEKCQFDILDKLLNASHEIGDFVEHVDVDSVNPPHFDEADNSAIINDIDIIE